MKSYYSSSQPGNLTTPLWLSLKARLMHLLDRLDGLFLPFMIMLFLILTMLTLLPNPSSLFFYTLSALMASPSTLVSGKILSRYLSWSTALWVYSIACSFARLSRQFSIFSFTLLYYMCEVSSWHIFVAIISARECFDLSILFWLSSLQVFYNLQHNQHILLNTTNYQSLLYYFCYFPYFYYFTSFQVFTSSIGVVYICLPSARASKMSSFSLQAFQLRGKSRGNLLNEVFFCYEGAFTSMKIFKVSGVGFKFFIPCFYILLYISENSTLSIGILRLRKSFTSAISLA